jgi:cold-inducible RNA-binding protein
MNSKLYVGNMSFKTSEADLRDAFTKFGTVTDVYIANDRETGRPRGFAFVTMGTADEAKAAIEKMNGMDLDGRALTVNEAKPKEEMGGGGGRGYSSPDRRPGAFQARGNSRY